MRKKIVKKIFAAVLTCSVLMNGPAIYNLNVLAEEVQQGQQSETVITSSEISVFRYQLKMKTDEVDCDSVSFRTVAKAPKAGEKIVAEGKEYTVDRVGIIYKLDDNKSGKLENVVLDDSYTILDESTRTGIDSNEYFTGIKNYKDKNRTFGYLASDIGIVNSFSKYDKNEQNIERYCYYVRTMTNMEPIMANSLIIRAFVLCTDGTIIYGKESQKQSVAEIAFTLYTDGRIGVETSFNYVFENILNSQLLKECNELYGNKNYIETPLEFGWSPLVRPWET